MLLVNPWVVDFAAYDFWIKPLGLLTIGAVLRNRGYHVELLDCMDRNHPGLDKFQRHERRNDGTGQFFKEMIPKPDLLKHIPRQYSRYGLPFSMVHTILSQFNRPDVICVTSGMTYRYPGVIEMIKLLRQHFLDVPIVLGGIYATLCREHARENSGADCVVVGEGENQIIDIVQQILGDSNSIEYDASNDKLLSPLYDLYPHLESVAVLTSRGCPFDCPFCASRQLTNNYRRRDPLQVVEEILTIYTKTQAGHFAFYDDALLLDKDTGFVPLIEELIKYKLPVHFHTPNGVHPKEIDENIAYLMKRAGFQTIRLSYETRNQERQRQMGFKVKDTDLKRAVQELSKAGFDSSQIGAYVLMGLPDQEIAEVVDSVMFVLGLGIKVNLASDSPIPGTRSWQEAIRLGYFKEDTDPLLANNSIFPMKSDNIPFQAFIDLGTLSSVANHALSIQCNPLQYDLFHDKMKVFQNTWMNSPVLN